MIKVLKKFFFLAVLISNLIKKLIFSLSVFLYNRAFKGKKRVAFGVIAFILLIVGASFVLFPEKNMANGTVINNKNLGQKIDLNKAVDLGIKDGELEIQESDLNKMMANSSTEDVDLFGDLDSINFQAISAGPIGRDEPFASRSKAGENIMGGPEGGSEGVDEGPSPQELLEQRRSEIRNALHNNVNLKGVVINSDKKDPMAIVQVMNENGKRKTITVKPGDEIGLGVALATVSEINESMVVLTSDDVSVEKYLPQFDDESNKSEKEIKEEEPPVASSTDPNLMSPPTPGREEILKARKADLKKSSMSDAKNKIEEIDKLLDSF